MDATPLPAGSLRATSLNAGRRAGELSTVADDRVDVLVVGGGVTGTGVALDAASRGLSAVLVESGDLASGASSRSGDPLGGALAHRGAAAASRAELASARGRAAERHALMTRTAPHLVRTLPSLVPLTGSVSRRSELLLSAGLRAEDALRLGARTPSSVLPPPRRVPRAEALALAPGIATHQLRGGLLSFTGQLVDDARLVVALARTAAGFGARVLTRVHARALDGDGADLTDQRTGEQFRLRARAVVNATGGSAAELVPDAQLHTRHESYVVIDADAVGIAGTALVSAGLGEQRTTVLPRPNCDAVLGRTTGSTEMTESDVDALLARAGDLLAEPPQRHHVRGRFTAPRPETPRPPWKRGTDETVQVGQNGVITASGGHRVLYRRRAARVVDTAVQDAGLAAGPSRTADIPLVGAATREHLSAVDAQPRLLAKYGTEAPRVAALSELDPDLADHVAPALTAAEVLWAVRHEGALDAGDVLDRRGTATTGPAERAAALPAVTGLVERALRGVEPPGSS